MKFCVSLLVIFLLIMGILAFAIVKKGDANLDGHVTLTDLVIVKAYILGQIKLNPLARYAADMNCDGKVDQKDFNLLKDLLMSQ